MERKIRKIKGNLVSRKVRVYNIGNLSKVLGHSGALKYFMGKAIEGVDFW